jgi:hypothetical protein
MAIRTPRMRVPRSCKINETYNVDATYYTLCINLIPLAHLASAFYNDLFVQSIEENGLYANQDFSFA